MQKRDLNFIKITFLHGYSSVNMLHICSRTPFLENFYISLSLRLVYVLEVLSKQVKTV